MARQQQPDPPARAEPGRRVEDQDAIDERSIGRAQDEEADDDDDELDDEDDVDDEDEDDDDEEA
jgi:hypothetical protein